MRSGKLYKCSKHYLLVYPSKDKATSAAQEAWAPETATSASTAVAAAVAAAEVRVDYWSKELNCKVRYSEPGEVFMVLKQKNEFTHVLFGEKQGWIINQDWLEIEEAVNDPR